MRWCRFCGTIALGVLLTGCYTIVPLMGATPVPGEEVAFDINDVGRVGLAASSGPEIAQITGTLRRRENEDYVVAVSSMRTIRGAEQVWKGEEIHIKPDYVATAYRRRYSQTRSIALGVASAAAIVLIGTQALHTARPTEGETTPPPVGSASHIPTTP